MPYAVTKSSKSYLTPIDRSKPLKNTRKSNHPIVEQGGEAEMNAGSRNPSRAQAPLARSPHAGALRIIAVTSGKGGVGKTNFVANLAVELAEMGKRVVILDADFGLANIDVLLGLNPRFHLGHVLFGKKQLSEIMVEGPAGVQVIPASSGLQCLAELTLQQRNFLVESFAQLEGDADYLLIDTAAGISSNVMHFLLAAPEIVVVSAPEPTAIVDAYAVIKIVLAEEPGKTIRVLINSASDEEEAREVFGQINSVVKRFLNREVIYLGHVERDPYVVRAIRSQALVSQFYPNAPATRCFRKLAQSLAAQNGSRVAAPTFVWEKLLNNWIN
jgi:flagellar biosynthesis protein FlhG